MSNDSDNLPFLTIGNDELENAPFVEKGEEIDCRHCGQKHVLEPCMRVADDGTKTESSKVLFYKCGETTYLAAIDNRLLSLGNKQ